MSARDADARGQVLDAARVEHTVLDQVDGTLREARDRIDARVAGRELRTAAQAGPVALDFGGSRACEEMTMLAARHAHGANRSTIDARRRHADEDSAVEARVVRSKRTVAGIGIESHGANYASRPGYRLAVFGRRIRGAHTAELPHNARFAAPPTLSRTMMNLTRRLLVALGAAIAVATAHAQAPERIVFATDWLAQAEHGGFYQALAEGTYR